MSARSNFYPRPPRGGRLYVYYFLEMLSLISIHALREEGDTVELWEAVSEAQFLSTPSARRATRLRRSAGLLQAISIHALREEGDTWCSSTPSRLRNFYPRPPRGGRRRARPRPRPLRDFYPRPPRGGRLAAVAKFNNSPIFLSTPSARRATAKTETKALFSNKLYNILHEFRRALIYNWSKNYPNRAK